MPTHQEGVVGRLWGSRGGALVHGVRDILRQLLAKGCDIEVLFTLLGKTSPRLRGRCPGPGRSTSSQLAGKASPAPTSACGAFPVNGVFIDIWCTHGDTHQS